MALTAVQKDGVTGTLRFFKKPFCRSDNQQMIKRIAELPFYNFIVEQIQITDKLKPFAAVLDICDVRSNLLQWF